MALVSPYPAPRLTRKGGVPAPAAVQTSGGQPFSRMWNARARVGFADTRTILGSPAMSGPAILRSLTYMFQGATAGGHKTSWLIGWSPVPVTQVFDDASNPPLPGTPLLDNSDVDDGGNAITLEGGTSVGFTQAVNTPWPIDLGYIIDQPQFYLWVCLQSVANAQQIFECSISIANQVGQDALSFFR